MLDKLIYIKGIGKFRDYTSVSPRWNGVLSKVTAIYADNGSGKTTFTQILKSLNVDYDCMQLQKRKTFDYDGDSMISFLSNGKAINYKNGKWNKKSVCVEVFDTFYAEDNVYVITVGTTKNSSDDLRVIIGNDSLEIYDKINELKRERKKQSNFRHNLKLKIKRGEFKFDDYQQLMEKSKCESKRIVDELSLFEKALSEQAENSGFLSNINHYLNLLCPGMQLTKLNRKRNNVFVYNICINGHVVREDGVGVSLKQTLSEGDKNALAFAFFLARLQMNSKLSESIVVFDDPISSLDYQRRHTTLNELIRISRKCKQLIVLSHDINFIKDISCRIPNITTLRICNDGKTSFFSNFDVEKETLTGIFKDMFVVQDYSKNFHASNYDAREVVRCIRPIIEGFFRIKYFGYLKDDMWLGDFIKLIREAKEGEVFFEQKKNLDVLDDINDYSKIYHHSNPNCLEEPIIDTELRIYCERTLDLLHRL